MATRAPLNVSLEGAELIQRAAECAPILRERAGETEALRRVHDENVKLLSEAGLFKILQPRIYGGYQQPVSVFLKAMAELGKGCGSTAWVAAIYNGIMWFASLFPEQAQEEVHETPNVITAGQIGPAGKCKRVDGGFVVDGSFPFTSGCHHSHWLIAGSPLLDDTGESLDHVVFLVPTSEATIKDDWHVTSMQGTGSNSFVLENVFVPEHRSLSLPQAVIGNYACTHLAGENLYRNAFVPLAAWFLLGPIIGMAEGAIQEFRRAAKGKPINYTFYEDQSEATVTHLQIGEAALKVEAAKALSERAAADVYEWAERDEYMDFESRARSRAQSGYTAQLCREAVDIIHSSCGGGVIHEKNPIQRYARDIQGVTNHAMIRPSSSFELYGRVLFDLPQRTAQI